MPLIAFDRSLLQIPVSDCVRNGIIVKQVVFVTGFNHQHDPVTELSSTTIIMLVKCYAPDPAAPNGLGPQLTGPQFNREYKLELTADNDTMVDVVTGHVVARRNKRETSMAPWNKLAADQPGPVAWQGDAMIEARRHPVVINDVLTGHVLNADAEPSIFA